MIIHSESTVFYVKVPSNQLHAALAALATEFDHNPAVYYETVTEDNGVHRVVIKVVVACTGEHAQMLRGRLERVQP